MASTYSPIFKISAVATATFVILEIRVFISIEEYMSDAVNVSVCCGEDVLKNVDPS